MSSVLCDLLCDHPERSAADRAEAFWQSHCALVALSASTWV